MDQNPDEDLYEDPGEAMDRGPDDDGEFDLDDLEELAAALHCRCMERGVAEAGQEWLDEPFAQWNENLERGRARMGRECACRLVVAMADALAARDALILSLVGGLRGEGATATMLGCATHPHEPDNVRLLYRGLDRAFNDASLRPDARRLRAGIGMLRDLAARAPGRFRVQPLCVVAYTLWWLGEDEAGGYARLALERDGSCVLARIICSAIEDEVCPAWRQ
ncbi:DUF4192 domain-containing protein [Bifidobacterium sp. ESL0763]|uniref:DUF4192 domain-containing protein n=1 Tax=Bifidobacterium sp. ESL0763 TaxID=2983227 RepID=UPI0023FA36B3|nr:DUF4192 domain-containing protein [Bifidobacterium sp. ESL0763]MDF7664068.1 DUF4192 domain-containing protein [Bifidobacterium sp. ESL0763]